ncbi:MAG: MATE family efflux transporter [Bacteroidota bacterium]
MDVKNLLTKNPRKLIFGFLLPTIAGQIIFAISRTAEKVFLGQTLGNEAIAAVGITFPLFTIIIAFSMWIRIGAGASISLALGKKDIDRAERVLGTAIWLLTAASIVIIVLVLTFLEDILLNIGANKDILPMSILYMQVTTAGLIINFYAFGVSHLIRAEGSPLKGMWLLVAGALVNVVLSFVFIKKLEWGIFGAALAPVSGNVVSMILIFHHLLKEQKSNLRLRRKYIKLDLIHLKSIAEIGVSAFIMMAGGSVIGMIANAILIRLGGVTYVGIMGGITYTFLFIQIIITGLCYGFQPLFGYSYGNSDTIRLRLYLRNALLLGTLCSLVAFLFIFISPDRAVAFFSQGNSSYAEVAIPIMKQYFMALPVVGFNMLGAYFFQSIGKAGKAIFLFGVQKVTLALGILVLSNYLQVDGVFLSFPIAEFVLFVTMVFVLYFELRSLFTAVPKLAKQ